MYWSDTDKPRSLGKRWQFHPEWWDPIRAPEDIEGKTQSPDWGCEGQSRSVHPCSVNLRHNQHSENKKQLINNQQECIPVGCGPPAVVAVCWGGGVLPQCMLGYTSWPDPSTSPLGVGLQTPTRPDPSTSLLGVGLETTPGQTPQLPPGCEPEDPPPRPLNLPLGVGLETCKACWGTTPSPLRTEWLTDTCKNIAFANFVCGR